MKENYFYIIKEDFFKKFSNMGCKFKYNKNANRPTYCCFEDKIHSGLYWAIPTGSIEDKNLDRINKYIGYGPNDIRSCFYHVGYTNRKALFFISSAFPIINKYIEREYTTLGVPLVLKRLEMQNEIKQKLLKILTYENQNPNKLEPHITTIKSELLKELKTLYIE